MQLLNKRLCDCNSKDCRVCQLFHSNHKYRTLWGTRLNENKVPYTWIKELEMPNIDCSNNSIIRYGGKLMMAFRGYGWQYARVFISELDENFKIKWFKQIEINIENNWQEDPRLFIKDNNLCIMFLSSTEEYVRQAYGIFDDNYELADWWELEGSRVVEKNWGLFDKYAVYSIVPHKVYKIDGGKLLDEFNNENKLDWQYGKMRGGASPILYNGEYYSFFHGHEYVGENIIYNIGLYTFEEKPPFKPLRVINYPLLFPTIPDNNIRRRKELQYIYPVFPCGAFYENNSWIISYGYYDTSCRVICFDGALIEDLLNGKNL